MEEEPCTIEGLVPGQEGSGGLCLPIHCNISCGGRCIPALLRWSLSTYTPIPVDFAAS